MTITLADRAETRENLFDVLRLLAASLVLYSHCYPLTGRGEPIGGVVGQGGGEIGVSVFFAISGYLVSRSFTTDPRTRAFAIKRALRLVPALAVAVWLTALILGLLVTDRSPTDYLTRPQTFVYPLRASLLVTFNGRLPGVFIDNPVAGAVNGSLWTLPVEASAYVGVALAGALALRRFGALAVAACVTLTLASSPLFDITAGGGTTGGDLGLVLYFLAIFAAGATLWGLRDRIPLTWPLGAAASVLWLLTWDTEWVTVTAIPFYSYVSLLIAYRGPAALRALTRPGDVSYGLYIYAYPTQQTIVHLWPQATPLQLLVTAGPLAYVLGLVSWRVVEHPALQRKRTLVG